MYHTSPTAAASEVTTRQAMRKAGFADAEIDETLLLYYVQQSLFPTVGHCRHPRVRCALGVRHSGTTVDSGHRGRWDSTGAIRVG